MLLIFRCKNYRIPAGHVEDVMKAVKAVHQPVYDPQKFCLLPLRDMSNIDTQTDFKIDFKTVSRCSPGYV